MTGPGRVAVGQFLLEANTFTPLRSELDIFAAAGLLEGPGLIREGLPDDELAVAWDGLVARGFTPVPTVRAWAGAGPPLTTAAFEQIMSAIVEPMEPSLAGVLLSLHGASAAEGVDDPEGVILEEVRRRIGGGVPMAVTLDCHAGLTARMLENVDIITGYRTVPHVDLARTGAQAARLLADAIDGLIRPVVKHAAIPMLAPADRQNNDLEPFRSLMGGCTVAEQQPGVLATAFFPSHPWRDVPELGWSTCCTADGDPELADETASGLAAAVWAAREEMIGGRRPPLDKALAEALDGTPPFVLADAGDSPSGGSPGDSTELLRAASHMKDRAIWLTVRDPEAASAAATAGVGATVSVSLGRGGAGEYNQATRLEAEVLAVPEGTFAYTGSLAMGKTGDLGTAVLLAAGEMRVVVHSQTVMVIDPAPYVAAGLDPAQAEVLQAKSHVSYREGFAPITTRSVVANTGGPTAADLTLLEYRRRPVPMFPFESDVRF
ncbi:MAG: M81 family metallopeptidase [bacterium]|nr:M81 family metallopeptidase [bacterium]MCY3633022.1 M81 family metallopeptidase [bacterium]